MKRFQSLLPWRFLLLTYGISWILWALLAATQIDITTNLRVGLIYVLGGFGPTIAGIITVHTTQNLLEMRNFWQRVLQPRRIQPRWLLVILGLYPTTLLLSFAIVAMIGGNPPQFDYLGELLRDPALLVIIALSVLLIGPVSEELGWRGYLQDWLQKRFSPLVASLWMGFAWWLWHVPLVLVVGSDMYGSAIDATFVFGFLGTTILYSILFTWVYNHNQRSVLAAILLHFSVNLSTNLLVAPPDVFMVELFLLMGIAVLVIVRGGLKPRKDGLLGAIS